MHAEDDPRERPTGNPYSQLRRKSLAGISFETDG